MKNKKLIPVVGGLLVLILAGVAIFGNGVLFQGKLNFKPSQSLLRERSGRSYPVPSNPRTRKIDQLAPQTELGAELQLSVVGQPLKYTIASSNAPIFIGEFSQKCFSVELENINAESMLLSDVGYYIDSLSQPSIEGLLFNTAVSPAVSNFDVSIKSTGDNGVTGSDQILTYNGSDESYSHLAFPSITINPLEKRVLEVSLHVKNNPVLASEKVTCGVTFNTDVPGGPYVLGGGPHVLYTQL